MSHVMEMPVLQAERELPQTYNYFAGRAGGAFLKKLRDEKKIIGIRCPKCKRVYVPPRGTCLPCFEEMHEFVEVGSEGTLVTYTVVNTSKDYHPFKTPFAYGIIRLDGADTGLAHMVGDVDFNQLKAGLRVKAVFREERVGSILDIRYFQPIS